MDANLGVVWMCLENLKMRTLMKSRLFLTVVVMERHCLVGRVSVKEISVSRRIDENRLKVWRAGVDNVPFSACGQ